MGGSRSVDMTGRRFGRLLVIERAENSKCGKSRWLCRCDCGKEKVVWRDVLFRPGERSCGCIVQRQPSIFIDMAGERRGRLQVLERAPRELGDGGRARWRCRCDCGNEVVVTGQRLRNSHTQSCGCLLDDRVREANAKRRAANANRRWKSKHPLYGTWTGMRSRCNSPNGGSYPNYGGRGITVDPRWDSFEQFVADMGPKPGPDYSIDRFPDNDGPYSPENCRWATPKEQIANRRKLTNLAEVASLTARIAELEAENARLLSLIPYDAQEAA